jgi:phosphatidyl-myo-inositol alpha-mannosyltransferase
MSRRPDRFPSRGTTPVTVGVSSSAMGASRASRRWPREVALFAGAYLLYSLARGISRGSEVEALENAARVVALQAEFGLNVERQVQEWITGLQVMSVLGVLYLMAQLVAVPLALIVVYRRRRSAYPLLRTTLLGAWLVAIPIYAIFPTAPPRLADIGIVDSVTRESFIPLDAPFVEYFYNPVAAVPSLHAAFAVAVGVGLAAATTVLAARIAALMWGPLVIVIVVATGNHFVLDVVAGLLVVGVAFAIAVALHGAPWSRPAQAPGTMPGLPGYGGAGPLRVALVCPYAWDAHGGVAAQVRDMAASLRRRGHHVDILAPADRRIDERDFHALGGTVRVRHNGSVGRVALSPWSNLRASWIVRRGRYDVVHLHEPLVPPCLSILLLSGRPMVGTFHMYGPDSRLYRVMAPLGRVAARRLHHRTAVSEAARSSTAKFLRGDYEVIPNGVSPHEHTARRDPDDREVRVLFIGRNDPRKGLAMLLVAAGHLPGVRLDLVGVDRDEVEALQKQLAPGRPLPGGVTAHGRVSDRRRSELLDQADILCAPSLKGESFGLVLVEAMSAGVAVVASAIPGYVDVLDGHGRTVPPGDADALAATLSELASDPQLRRRLGEGGRRAAARFEWDHVTARMLDAYRTAIAVRYASEGTVAVPVVVAADAVGAAAVRVTADRSSASGTVAPGDPHR